MSSSISLERAGAASSGPAWPLEGRGALSRLVESEWFRRVALAAILANALLMGLETSPALRARLGPELAALHLAFQVWFVAEIGLRLLAWGRRPLAFFRDGWNTFDFTVVALSLLPESGGAAAVARLARLLRATRLVSSLPGLRLLVATMLRSVASMGNVMLLLGLILYVYAILGVNLFGRVDPAHWGSLGAAFLTLFQVLTLEGWVELQRTGLAATPWAWLFYTSFVVVAVFVVVNLFIAVVISNLEAAKRAEAGVGPAPAHSIAEIRARLDELEAALGAARREHS